MMRFSAGIAKLFLAAPLYSHLPFFLSFPQGIWSFWSDGNEGGESRFPAGMTDRKAKTGLPPTLEDENWVEEGRVGNYTQLCHLDRSEAKWRDLRFVGT